MGVGSALMGFFALVWRILEGIRKVLHLLLLLVIFGFILAALHTSIPIVPRSAALVIAPEGELVEQLASDPVRRAFGQASGGPAPETLLRDVTDAIAAAKTDARIKLIVLDLGSLDASVLSKLQEIGAGLRDFRAAGKRVVAAADSLDQTQYYLAAQAGEVYLDPMGLVYLDGFSYYRMFFKDAIDKLGVDVNVFRAGTFKSYTDQFSRSDMAPSERDESCVWLAALWGAYNRTSLGHAHCPQGRSTNSSPTSRRRLPLWRRCSQIGAAARPGHGAEESPANGRRIERTGGRRRGDPFLQLHRHAAVSGAVRANAS